MTTSSLTTNAIHPAAATRLQKLAATLAAALAAGAALCADAPDGGWKSRAIAISAPAKADVERFNAFVRDTLAPAGVDTIVLLVRYRYAFKSHPECAAENPLSADDARAIRAACDAAGIRLIPDMNLFGHQGSATKPDQLLKAHPEFDETPDKKTLIRNYCRSLCPSHPDALPIVSDLAIELAAAFGADTIHIGCDEVFEIGHCPRCRDTPTATLYANWVNGLARKLKEKGVGTMIWGDRLLNAKDTGYGVWEASDNGTHTALSLLDPGIDICDWHYEVRPAYPSVEIFEKAGRKYYLCFWKNGNAAKKFLAYAAARDCGGCLGIMLTTWHSCAEVMDAFEGDDAPIRLPEGKKREALLSLRNTFRQVFSVPKAAPSQK